MATRLSTISDTPTLVTSQNSRLSTISKASEAPSHATTSTVQTTNPKHIDITTWHTNFEKLRDARLEEQRYRLTEGKKDEQSKLALGAKLDRALGRRMTGQDAQMRRVVVEKA